MSAKKYFSKVCHLYPNSAKNFKLKHQSFEIWHGCFGTATRNKNVSDFQKLLNSQCASIK